MLSPIRIGADYTPIVWFTIGVRVRRPVLRCPAPYSLHDTVDLQERYIELFRKNKSGLEAVFGHQMLNYGDSRLFGSPQWSNISRTFDWPHPLGLDRRS